VQLGIFDDSHTWLEIWGTNPAPKPLWNETVLMAP